MRLISKNRSLLLTTALTVPLGGMAFAQSIEINEEQLVGKSQECQTLARDVQAVDISGTAIDTDAVITAINEDISETCAMIGQRIMTSADNSEIQSDTENASETVSREVDLSEEATIEGQARVSVPDPDVDVQVPAPNVRVTSQQPQVDITQDPTRIELEQVKPTITVEIPNIIVRVDVPAPKVYVLRSDPEVRVSSNDPQVEVQQGEPVVRVTQADPELSVDLGVDAEQNPDMNNEAQTFDDGEPQLALGDATGDGSQQVVGDDTSVASNEAQVEIVQAEGETQSTYETGDPTVSWESVEPEVQVMMAEQPTIEVSQSGEPTVTVETAEEREQRRAARTEPQADAENKVAATNEQEQPTVDGGEAMAGGMQMLTVGDLKAMEVVTADGENLGDPSAIIEINGEPNVVLSDGGFLGFGEKEVPVPMSRISLNGDALKLDSLTEDEIESANDFNYDSNLALPDDQQIEVNGG